MDGFVETLPILKECCASTCAVAEKHIKSNRVEKTIPWVKRFWILIATGAWSEINLKKRLSIKTGLGQDYLKAWLEETILLQAKVKRQRV
ncbi:MAG: hypothetical protein RLN85_12050, partial [Pseudomonadales bacterium]